MRSVRRLCLLAVMVFGASGVAHAQTTPDPAKTTNTANEGRVTFGIVSFLQYDYELHERTATTPSRSRAATSTSRAGCRIA